MPARTVEAIELSTAKYTSGLNRCRDACRASDRSSLSLRTRSSHAYHLGEPHTRIRHTCHTHQARYRTWSIWASEPLPVTSFVMYEKNELRTGLPAIFGVLHQAIY